MGQGIHAEHHLRTDVDIGREQEVAPQLVLQGGDVTDKQVRILLRQVHQGRVQLPHLVGQRAPHLIGVAAEDRILDLGVVEVDDLLIGKCGVLTDRGDESQPVVGQRLLLDCVQHTVLLSELMG